MYASWMKNLSGRQGRSSLTGDDVPPAPRPPFGPPPSGAAPAVLQALTEATSNFGEDCPQIGSATAATHNAVEHDRLSCTSVVFASFGIRIARRARHDS